MDRRHFLQTMSAAAGCAAAGPLVNPARAQSTDVNRVIVVGAGIVGAAIAYHLSKRDCDVVIVEKNLPASQASGNTFAWINASYTNTPESYRRLRQQSLDDYRQLAQEVPLPIRWGGSLEWFEDEAGEAQLIGDVREFRKTAGESTSIVSADRAREIEPNLALNGNWQCAWSADDGAIDAATATQALFDRALTHGAQPRLLSEVTRLRERRGQLRVTTDAGRLDADLVVIAAGVGSARLAEQVGEYVDTATRATPGIIVTTEPLPPLVNGVLYPPQVHIHQQSDGRVIIGEKAGPPTTTEHAANLKQRPNAFTDAANASSHVGRILAMARRYVPQLADVRRAEVGIGWRPMPEDGLPIIGHGSVAPNVYFATMHSGISLAPVVGRMAAEEILNGTRFAELNDFRPVRFAAQPA